MTMFWIIAAGMLILALAFVIPPFLRKPKPSAVSLDELNLSVIKQQLSELDKDLANGDLDQDQYEAARNDLEKELLEDIPEGRGATEQAGPRSGRWGLVLAAIGIPVLTIALYGALGNQDIIPRLGDTGQVQAGGASRADHDQGLPPMEVLVEKLAQRLEQDPNNVDGWIMLARSYVAMGQGAKAMKSYETAYRLAPADPKVLLSYAQFLARLQNNRLAGRPAELIGKAVELAPSDPNALWMMGMVHFEQNDFAKAAGRWEQVAALLPPTSQDLPAVRQRIAQARAHLAPGTAPTSQVTAAAAAPAAQPTPVSTATGTKGRIDIEVSLAPELQDKVSATYPVFIFARALQGPRMPLAAVRKQVKDLPLRLTLDDSLAMTPQFVLSAFPQVVVGARVSKSGNPIPQSGDLQGEVRPVTPGQGQPVNLVIDSLRP